MMPQLAEQLLAFPLSLEFFFSIPNFSSPINSCIRMSQARIWVLKKKIRKTFQRKKKKNICTLLWYVLRHWSFNHNTPMTTVAGRQCRHWSGKDADAAVFLAIVTGQSLSVWQVICEPSWRPRWKFSKADNSGSCTGELKMSTAYN